jgi:hypothetical protein
MKVLFNEETKIKTIGLLTILIGLWLVLYFIPELFVSLFNTLLGNLILLVATILVYMNNKMFGVIFTILILILYRFSQLSKEGFATQNNLTIDFLRIQNTINKNKVFDMNIIHSQTSEEELKYFNQNGKWPWSQNVINLYEEAVNRNPYTRTLPEISTDYARTIYNENAILRILTYQTKEGQFLLNGIQVQNPSGNKMEELASGFGNFPYETGLLDNRVDDIIKCNMNDSSNPILERITYTGKGAIFGEQTQKVNPLDYNNLEKIIPGFTFLNGPCNPCSSMADNPDYSCAYQFKLKNKQSDISSIWQYLWKK